MGITDEISINQELPPLRKGPITRQHLVEWCAAENDYYNLHYDERVAERMALPGTPIQGTYRFALMGQLISHWLAARPHQLRRITANYRGADMEGSVITARGVIREILPQPEGRLVRLDVWIESETGERSTSGEAEVLLPGHSSA